MWETEEGRVRMQSAQRGSAGHFGTEEVWEAAGFPVCVWFVVAFPECVRCQCRCHPIRYQGLLRLHTAVSPCSELPLRVAALLVFCYPMGMQQEIFFCLLRPSIFAAPIHSVNIHMR